MLSLNTKIFIINMLKIIKNLKSHLTLTAGLHRKKYDRAKILMRLPWQQAVTLSVPNLFRIRATSTVDEFRG